jgi:hypothetical protein
MKKPRQNLPTRFADQFSPNVTLASRLQSID